MPLLEYLSASAGVTTAGNVLYSRARAASTAPGSKENDIRNRSLKREILPPLPAVPFVRTPLLRLISNSYVDTAQGDTHVVYAPPSQGKTTACQAFMHEHSRGLMITSTSSEFYLSHLAKVLEIDKEENVLSDLVRGLATVKPSPSSVLILDEFNHCGPDNCNIHLVEILMRYIYQQRAGIILYVVSQNKKVGDELCALNEWQKIGPLEGLTDPSRKQVVRGQAPLPPQDHVPWLLNQSEWSLRRLTILVESRHTDVHYDKTEDGVIVWLQSGMTPKAALDLADELQRSTATDMADEEEGILE